MYMASRDTMIESWEVVKVALARKAAIDRGEMGTTSLDVMIAEFAPELRRAHRRRGAHEKKRP